MAIVREASEALARLDAARLEELAQSCRLLNRRLSQLPRDEFAIQVCQAAREMILLGRVLEGTEANLQVMRRLHPLRAGEATYAESAVQHWAESLYGHN
jgi:hypothetical protein